MIKEFIQQYLKEKLSRHHSLVIYDPTLFYHDLVMEMATEDLTVFDASTNVVTAREEAMDYWVNEMPAALEKKMVFYVPFAKKMNDDQKAIDPFILFTSGGTVFPDEATDDYKQICLLAMPEKAAKIEELFSHGTAPEFSKIDALKGGNTYPSIKGGLGASSPVEILQAFLIPTESQRSFLEKDKSWVPEFKSFMADVIGVKPTSRKFETLQKDLWRIVLYSEFVYDLPVAVPAELSGVAKAKEEAKQIIYKVCMQLRSNKHQEEVYVQHANEISDELSLPKLFKAEINLGEINTFAFEDSTFFNQFKEILLKGKIDDAMRLAKTSSKGIWSEYDDERRAAWQIGLKACELVQTVLNQKEKVKNKTAANDMIHWYAKEGFTIDTLQREMEKQVQMQIDLSDALEEVAAYARKVYQEFMEKVQQLFQKSIVEEKSIDTDIQKNITLFDQKVQPLINAGKKTVYILADALRYELAGYLMTRLQRADFECDIAPSLAFSPTVTKYAMAALMPQADKALELKVQGGKLEPFLNGKQSGNRADRVKYTTELLGDKCAWYWEKDIIKDDYEKKDLLFVTTTEIDQAGENVPENAQHLIEMAIQKILKVSSKLAKAGYDEFVLVADHGFVLLNDYVSGSNASKAVGEWVLQKSRCLAGKGAENEDHIVLTPEQLSIKSDVSQFFFLKNYAVYERGTKFFHEGLSLQEIITPCLSFRPVKKKVRQEIQINLSYKGKTSGYVTTRRPSIEIACFGEAFFDEPTDVAIEAKAGEKSIGTPAQSEHVNSTTSYIEITPGQSIKVTLALDEDYEGKFTVYAQSPSTGVILSEINLETDYL